jgi:hypothetical protein
MIVAATAIQVTIYSSDNEDDDEGDNNENGIMAPEAAVVTRVTA